MRHEAGLFSFGVSNVDDNVKVDEVSGDVAVSKDLRSTKWMIESIQEVQWSE